MPEDLTQQITNRCEKALKSSYELWKKKYAEVPTNELERIVKDQLRIPLPRGRHTKDRSWLLQAIVIMKMVRGYTRTNEQIPSPLADKMIRFFGRADLQSASLSFTDDQEEKTMKHATPHEHDKPEDAGQGIIEEVKASRKAKASHDEKPAEHKHAKAEKPARAKKTETTATPHKGRENVTSGHKIVALNHEFKRKTSNQAKVFEVIKSHGAKGITYEDLIEEIKTKVPEEKKPEAAAWWAFWFFAKKKGFAKLIKA